MSKKSELAAQQTVLLDCSPQLFPRNGRDIPCDDAAKAKLIDGLRAGQTVWEMLNADSSLPDYGAISKALKADPQFAADMQDARDMGNVIRIEEGMHYQGSVRGNKQLSIAAEKYVNSAIKVAEKLSPKTMGQLIRHADAEGNKLTVNVVNFEIAAPDKPKALEVIATDASTNDRLSSVQTKIEVTRDNSALTEQTPSTSDA